MIYKILLFLIIILINSNISYSYDIIIDPGHSPNKPGAISCIGEKEYLYNDTLVDYIFNNLNKNKINVQKTRQPNENLSLKGRVKNTKDKNLFISIHHDSVQPQFINYVNNNPISTKGKGYSIFISRKNKYFDKSLQHAKNIARYLHDMGLRPSTHHGENIKGENREAIDKELGIYYFDDLIVVKNSECPALLLEAGVIVNPEDEKLVKTNAYKNIISQAIINSIERDR